VARGTPSRLAALLRAVSTSRSVVILILCFSVGTKMFTLNQYKCIKSVSLRQLGNVDNQLITEAIVQPRVDASRGWPTDLALRR